MKSAMLGLLAVVAVLAGCSSQSSSSSLPDGPVAPSVSPTVGAHSSGALSYTWQQVYTSPDENPSIYNIHVTSGWQGKQVSGDLIAVYIADDIDSSFGDTAPLTLQIDCANTSVSLADGTYVRNIGGTVDVTWSTYVDTGSSCS